MKFIRDLLARKKPEQPKAEAPLVEEQTAYVQEEASIEPGVPKDLHADLPSDSDLIAVSQEEMTKDDVDVKIEAEEATADVEETEAVTEPEITAEVEPEPETEVDTASNDILNRINADFQTEATTDEAKVNIWDLDEADAPAPIAETPKPRRRRRNQTRLLGFDTGESNVVSAFDTAEKVAPTKRAQFPVGWVVVADGPGRGECFALEAGMSQIGRGEDQAIQLDFGDTSISRVNHAAIVYDQESHSFILGHGGKKNIVRLNNKPVISNEEIKSADEIKVGETTLRFMALCTAEFNWANKEDPSEEQDHVAIA